MKTVLWILGIVAFIVIIEIAFKNAKKRDYERKVEEDAKYFNDIEKKQEELRLKEKDKKS